MNKTLFSFVNPTVMALLRSPLHRLMSGNTALIEFSGHKSGRTYRMPVSYHQTDGGVDLFTDRSNAWWRNLRGGAEMTILVRGTTYVGRPRVEVEPSPAKNAALAAFLTAVPRDARHAGVELDRGGHPAASDIEEASGRLVLISIDLS